MILLKAKCRMLKVTLNENGRKCHSGLKDNKQLKKKNTF